MKYHLERDELEFECSGRQEYANQGILGIEEISLSITAGYDNPFMRGRLETLSPAERAELADYMIGLWQRFKERLNDPADQ